jgi:hypothetical protein
MDGYSVTEAASILGVPTEKVWELIARGVLAGAHDGERGMRVFLQGRPQPPVIDAVRPSEAPPPREPDRELSPFRELLTEFRNLTERYGQALLALGEARGEVAALRSRVDLLEARMDLRLPPPATTAAPPLPDARWVAQAPEPGPEPESVAEPAVEPEVVAEPDIDESVMAEEAAEAGPVVEPAAADEDDEDATEVETAFVATAVRIEAGVDAADVEGAGADIASAADTRTDAEADADTEPEAQAGTEADGEAEREPEAQADVEAAPEAEVDAPMDAEAGVEAEAEAEAEAEVEPGTEADLARSRRRAARWTTETFAEALARAEDPTEPELPGTADAAAALAALRGEVDATAAELPRDAAMAEEIEPAEDIEPVEEPPVQADAEPPDGDVEVPTAPEPEPLDGAWDRDRYSTAIEEPDWYAEIERPFEPSEVAPASADQTSDESAPQAATVEPEPLREPAWPQPIEEPPAVEPPSTRSDEEELLWFGARAAELAESSAGRAEQPEWPPEDGAVEMEVAGSRSASGSAFPGSSELREALTALDTLARESRPVPLAPAEEHRRVEPPPPPSPAPWRPPIERPTAATPHATTPTGPASRAYRRLRRIFPG